MRSIPLFMCSGALATLMSVGSPIHAQQSTSPGATSPNDLKAPTAPAFVVLGVSPSKVERPQAVRPLVLSALSALSSEGFPKNYAVEFAPYWLGTPQLSFDDYYASGVAKAIPRHLSISVATTPLGKVADSGTAIAMGVRTLPFPGRRHPKLEPLLKRLRDLQLKSIDEEGFFSRHVRLITLLQEAQGAAVTATGEELASKPFEDLVDTMIDLDIEIKKGEIAIEAIPGEIEEAKQLPPGRQKPEIARLEKELADTTATLAKNRKERRQLAAEMVKMVKEGEVAANLATEKTFEVLVARYDQAQRARVAKIDGELKATALAIQALDTERIGPLLAVATAVAWDVPANETSMTSLSRVAFWATPGYRMVRCAGEGGEGCSTSVDLLAVVRYLDNRRPGETGELWEFGARAIWQARPSLAVSAEWLGRSGDDRPGARIVGVAEYEIRDSTFLYASFGRDFEEPGVRQNLVSTIGLTFGLGKKPIVELPR